MKRGVAAGLIAAGLVGGAVALATPAMASPYSSSDEDATGYLEVVEAQSGGTVSASEALNVGHMICGVLAKGIPPSTLVNLLSEDTEHPVPRWAAQLAVSDARTYLCPSAGRGA